MRVTIILLLISISLNAGATASILNKYFTEPTQLGEVRVKYMWLDIYDISLYANNSDFDFSNSFALEISYLRNFKGEHIADRSITEIKEQGFIDDKKLREWHKKIEKIFPNVSKGDVIVGVKDSQGFSHFYLNGQSIGLITDTELSERFFDIWLGPKSSYPKYTEQLLGS